MKKLRVFIWFSLSLFVTAALLIQREQVNKFGFVLVGCLFAVSAVLAVLTGKVLTYRGRRVMVVRDDTH